MLKILAYCIFNYFWFETWSEFRTTHLGRVAVGRTSRSVGHQSKEQVAADVSWLCSRLHYMSMLSFEKPSLLITIQIQAYLRWTTFPEWCHNHPQDCSSLMMPNWGGKNVKMTNSLGYQFCQGEVFHHEKVSLFPTELVWIVRGGEVGNVFARCIMPNGDE